MPAMRWSICLLLVAFVVPAAAAEEPIKKTLIIGIDGCRPDALLAAKAPNLRRLMAEGSFSDKTQSLDRTVSGPCWSSLLTGVNWPKHLVKDNGFAINNFKRYPTLLTRYKAAHPKGFVASIAHWEGIAKIVTEADHASTHKTAAETARTACKVLTEKDPDIVFVQFDDVDGAGHKFGFHPKEVRYLEAIAATDQLIGDILKAVKGRKNYAKEDWLIIVSTDHGGKGKGHGQDIPECRTIFLIVSGKSAARGTIEPAPTIMDIAPTALTHMGIPIDPAWKLDGKAVGLKPR